MSLHCTYLPPWSVYCIVYHRKNRIRVISFYRRGTKFFLSITNLKHFFNVFIYFTSLNISSNPVLIIRRIELYQYIWYMSHLNRVTYTRRCIDTIRVFIIRRIELYQYIIWYMSLCVGVTHTRCIDTIRFS